MTNWEQLLTRNDLNEMDFVCEDEDGIYRGPVSELKLDSDKGTFTIKTAWVGKFNPVNMRWVLRFVSLQSSEYGIDIDISKVEVDEPMEKIFVRLKGKGTGEFFAYLVPHKYSKLNREDLI